MQVRMRAAAGKPAAAASCSAIASATQLQALLPVSGKAVLHWLQVAVALAACRRGAAAAARAAAVAAPAPARVLAAGQPRVPLRRLRLKEWVRSRI